MKLNVPLAAAVVAAIASACVGASHPQPLTAPISIPFELRNDLPVIHVRVNGVDALLVLDTGSGALVLDSALAAQAHVHLGSFMGAKANGRTPMRVGTTDTVAPGGRAAMSNVLTVVTDLASVQRRLGYDVRGTIGNQIFRDYVVTVDYRARTVTLADPTRFQYAGTGVPLAIRLEHNVPVTDAVIVTRRSGAIPASLTVDLGSSSYALRLSRRFLVQHPLDADTTTVPVQLGAGVGGVDQGELLRLPALRVGALTVSRPSTVLSLAHDGAFGDDAPTDGTIGAGVLRRARLTIDYTHSVIYVEPESSLALADSIDASGMAIARIGATDPRWRVEAIVPTSPADSAGVQVGDVITAVDGRPIGDLASGELQRRLRDVGTTCRLTIERAGRAIPVRFVLRSVV